jgi:hypothetical protein
MSIHIFESETEYKQFQNYHGQGIIARANLIAVRVDGNIFKLVKSRNSDVGELLSYEKLSEKISKELDARLISIFSFVRYDTGNNAARLSNRTGAV